MSKVKTIATKAIEKGVKNTYVKDENGYYKIRLGRFNTFNRSGIYYRVANLDEVTGPNSIFYKRLTSGYLRSEVSHPERIREIGEKLRRDPSNVKLRTELVKAVMFLDLENVCAHIKKVEFVNTDKREPGFNLPIIDVWGWVKPSGPKKQILQEALDNPDENVAFSIRSVTTDSFIGRTIVKDIKVISTWDYVYEPGISGSSKWAGAGIEYSLDASIKEIDDKVISEISYGIESACEDGQCALDAIKRIKEKYQDTFKKWLFK